MNKNNTFYLLSLGCPKNEVDAESMSYALRSAGYSLVTDPDAATFLIVNTCGFIQSAKEEAIAAILDLIDYKISRTKQELACYLIVTGCLAQRYAREIYQEFPEVDAVLGTSQYQEITPLLNALLSGSRIVPPMPAKPGSIAHLYEGEQASEDRPFAYLKIAEGCSNYCAFCAIPGIRGPLLSRPIEDIVKEAETLTRRGFKEIILVAQDTTRYGLDLYGEPKLLELLKRLVAILDLGFLRLMYVYGDVFSDELIDFIAENEKVASYIDLPIQHASDKILRAMHRRDSNQSLRELITKLKAKIPDLVIRTTVMVGFPGETEEDFQELLQFVKDMEFDRLGCFVFSPEEGTKAYSMSDLPPKSVSESRQKQIMDLQKGISLAKNRARIGKIYPVLLEEISTDGLFFMGRSYQEAPAIDPSIYVLAQSDDLKIGDLVPVRIIDADEYDLTGVSVL